MDDNVKLPVDVSDLGELKVAKMECPGIYYVAVLPAKTVMGMCDEYYIVTKDAPLTKAARAYGKPYHNGTLIYNIGEDSGAEIVGYEIAKYLTANNLPLDGDDIRSLAIYGAEMYPEYFGPIPPPLDTPWGYLTRYRPIDNGIYVVETDEGREGLAIAYPIWSGDLSNTAIKLGEQSSFDATIGINETLGYLFFDKNTMAVAIFELVRDRTRWIRDGIIDYRALTNAVWAQQPDYAVINNIYEQSIEFDVANTLGDASGIDDGRRYVTMDPSAGTDYLKI